MARARPSKGRGSSLLTLLFGALAVVLAAAAIVLWLRDRDGAGRDEPPVPTAAAGENEFIHVVQALEAEGLETVIVQGGLPAGELGAPGQRLDVNGVPLYVFLYPDAAAAATPAARLDPATALPAANARGTPVATEPPHLAHGSNVIVALVGGDDELRARVDAAIARLA